MTAMAGNLQADCTSVLHACDDAVTALQKENALQKQIIIDQDNRFATEHKELETEKIWEPVALGGIIIIGVETLVLVLKH